WLRMLIPQPLADGIVFANTQDELTKWISVGEGGVRRSTLVALSVTTSWSGLELVRKSNLKRRVEVSLRLCKDMVIQFEDSEGSEIWPGLAPARKASNIFIPNVKQIATSYEGTE